MSLGGHNVREMYHGCFRNKHKSKSIHQKFTKYTNIRRSIMMDESYVQALFFCAMQFINHTLLSRHTVPPSFDSFSSSFLASILFHTQLTLFPVLKRCPPLAYQHVLRTHPTSRRFSSFY